MLHRTTLSSALALWTTLLVLISTGCTPKPSTPPTAPTTTAPTQTTPHATTAPRTTTPAAPTAPALTITPGPVRVAPTGRIVALGDVHGDLNALKRALRAAGVIDDKDRWSGGTTTLVQTGDVLDRGNDERAIIALFERLTLEAKEAGGLVVWLMGNHEIMNVQGDIRYITPGGFKEFQGLPGLHLDHPKVKAYPEQARARVAAFMPGGPYAMKFAGLRVIAIVGDTVFVHGGVLPSHVAYGLDTVNAQTSAWIQDKGPLPVMLVQPNSPIWTRVYSRPDKPAACSMLRSTLSLLKASRMVVGHSVQPQGITSACDGAVWRIDVGMSSHYGGQPAALEIKGDVVRIIQAKE